MERTTRELVHHVVQGWLLGHTVEHGHLKFRGAHPGNVEHAEPVE